MVNDMVDARIMMGGWFGGMALGEGVG